MTQFTNINQLQDTILGQIFTPDGYLILQSQAIDAASDMPTFDITTTLNMLQSINWSSMTDELVKEILTLNPVAMLAQLTFGESEFLDGLRKEVFGNMMRTTRVLRESQAALFDGLAGTMWYIDTLETLTNETIMKLIQLNELSPQAGASILVLVRKSIQGAYDHLAQHEANKDNDMIPEEAFNAVIELLNQHGAKNDAIPESLQTMLTFEYMAASPDSLLTFHDFVDALIIEDEETGHKGLVDVTVELPEEVDVPTPMLVFSNDLLPASAASAIMTRVFVNRDGHSMPDAQAELFFNYSYLFDLATIIPFYNVFTTEQQLDSMPTLAELYTNAMMDGQEPLGFQLANMIRELNEENAEINFIEAFLVSISDFMGGAQYVDGSAYNIQDDVVLLGARLTSVDAFRAFSFRFMRDIAMFGARSLPEGYFADLAQTHPVHDLMFYFLPLELTALREDTTLDQYTEEELRSGIEFLEVVEKDESLVQEGSTRLEVLTQKYIDSGVITTEAQAKTLEATWAFFQNLRPAIPRVQPVEGEVVEQQ